MQATKQCYAIVIEKDTFDAYTLQNVEKNDLTMSREEAIQTVAAALGEKDAIVSTTGMISRELFEYRTAMNEGHERDFLTVGSMGHASQIALGIALAKQDRKVWCFDGDGASIMHMGSMAIVANKAPKNYVHVVFNNGAHDSVGGQPTVGLKIDLPAVAKAVGYNHIYSVETKDYLKELLEKLKAQEGPVFLEVKVKKGNRKDLGRPTTTPIQNKEAFNEIFMQVIYNGISHLGEALKGATKVFVVCDSSYPFLNIKSDIENMGTPHVLFSNFTPNPLYEQVCKGIELFQITRCDSILAVGGGSAIDVAKCIKLAVLAKEGNAALIPPLVSTRVECDGSKIPFIAIPTTTWYG